MQFIWQNFLRENIVFLHIANSECAVFCKKSHVGVHFCAEISVFQNERGGRGANFCRQMQTVANWHTFSALTRARGAAQTAFRWHKHRAGRRREASSRISQSHITAPQTEKDALLYKWSPSGAANITSWSETTGAARILEKAFPTLQKNASACADTHIGHK